MRKFYELMYTNQLDNLDETDKFLEKPKFPKLVKKKQNCN